MADCHAGACGSLSLSLVVESDSASAGAERPARLRGRKQQAPAVIAPVVVVVVTKQECLHARSCAKLFWGFLRGEMWRPPTGGEGGFGGGFFVAPAEGAFVDPAEGATAVVNGSFQQLRPTLLCNASERVFFIPRNGSLQRFHSCTGFSQRLFALF